MEQRLPVLDIPLLPGDGPAPLDLQAVFGRCYDAGPYRREINYGVDAIVPPLAPEKAAWAAGIVGSASAPEQPFPD